jgi:hypothetical protein
VPSGCSRACAEGGRIKEEGGIRHRTLNTGGRRSRFLSLVPILFLAASASADSFRLILPRGAPPPVSFGAAEMTRALTQAGHGLARGRATLTLTVATNGPGGPEGFVIEPHGSSVRVVGGGAVGAMYGLLEVAEQVSEARGQPLLQALRPTIRRPFLELRADSPTLWLGAQGSLPRVLADVAFWRRYVSNLARSRFNLLHLHGFADPATGRSHSLLERLMPASGQPDAAARRAIASLSSLAALCRSHGLKLAITDDAASEAPAVAASARRLLAAVPGLWGLGVRTPGSGELALMNSMLRGVLPHAFLALPGPTSDPGPSPFSLDNRPYVVLPANAGSFALPYPVVESMDPSPSPASGARAPESTPPAPVDRPPLADPSLLLSRRPDSSRLLWEVPAGRIAPALPWYDPEFIRRTVRAAAAMTASPRGAQGILVEPPESFFAPHIPHPATPETSWWWHPAWGRLAYNPAEADTRLDGWFKRRYGEESGWRVARTLARISTVVPMIAAAHAALPAGGGPCVPELDPGPLEEWAGGPTMDERALADVPAWGAARLSGEGNGRLDPVQLSFSLAEAAMRTRNEVDTIEILHPRRPQEWHELRRRIEALCHLADFGARRLSAAAHLEMHRRTGDEMELELASGHDSLAAVSWAAMERMLAPGGEKEVGHMSTPDRPPSLEGLFAADATTLSKLHADLTQELAQARTTPRIAHVPAQRATPTRAHRITATVMSGATSPTVTLVYRFVDSSGTASPEKERPMTRLFDTQAFYQAEIQGPELKEGFLEYQIRATSGGGASAWPADGSWRRVPVTRDEAGPTVRPLVPTVSGRKATLACESADPAGVRRVLLYFRPLAGRGAWQEVPMTPASDHYQAQVPLAGEGLQYAFRAEDTWGNCTAAPDVRSTTPYLILLPPALARGSHRIVKTQPGH